MTHRRVNPDEIQLRIDPIHADVDEEITGLRSQVRRLRNCCPAQITMEFTSIL
ncbi:hypothetical protein ABKV19_025493 [Rosa sericea]